MSGDPLYLARTRSTGVDKKAPPPVKPKPSALASPPTDVFAVTSPTPVFRQQRSSVTVTDNGAPTSSSFGDLRKTFERQQNSAPLFMASNSTGTLGTGAASGGATLGVARGSMRTGQLSHHASISRVQQHSNNNSNSLQLAPSSNSTGNGNGNNSNSNRPRSVSSPGPPLRETDDDADGIDNSQPDFGNLRARFQSQMSLSGSGAPKPVRQNLRLTLCSFCGL